MWRGIALAGSFPHPDHRLSIPAVQLTAEERTLKGSYFGSCVPARDIPRFISLYQRGKLPINKLLSEIVRLDELNEAFDRLADAKTIRQVMTIGGAESCPLAAGPVPRAQSKDHLGMILPTTVRGKP